MVRLNAKLARAIQGNMRGFVLAGSSTVGVFLIRAREDGVECQSLDRAKTRVFPFDRIEVSDETAARLTQPAAGTPEKQRAQEFIQRITRAA